MSWDGAQTSREILLNREWLVTNGLGGYASGTVSGAITRKYHGILVAALPAPLGRVVMWNHVSEFLRFEDNEVVSLGAEERAGGQLDLHGAEYLREFRLEDGLPVWIYHVRDLVIEKRSLLPHLQNTVHVSYQIIGGGKAPRLELRPAFHFRHHEAEVDLPLAEPYKLSAVNDRYEITSARRKFPPLRMRLCGRSSAFTIAPSKIPQVVYRTEQARGYAHEGELWSPGFSRSIWPNRKRRRSLDRPSPGKSSMCWRRLKCWRPNASGARVCWRGPRPRRAKESPRNWFLRATNLSSRRPAGPRKRRALTPPATKFAPSLPDIIGSPTGAATR